MLAVRLIGPPALERDGVPVRAPRGRKAWALLAYVLLAERPPSRSRLAELLFGEADDPLGALRWTLAELRRALAAPGALRGDPVALALPAGVSVDVRERLLDADGELLEGMQLPGSPEFEAWLLVERRRVSGAVEALLRQAAVERLAGGGAGDAVGYAARAVARNPLEEGNHELLVRSLAAAGDRAGALRQVAAAEDVLRRELGIAPSPALREAAGDTATVGHTATVPALSGRPAALSQLEAGKAAIVAGAAEAGVRCLRRAVAEAEACGDHRLHGRALAALGSALVHAVRGRDGEGAIALRAAIELATIAADRATLVAAHRELGFVEVQAGRRETAHGWLAAAQELAGSDEEVAAVLGVRGMHACDAGDYPAAFAYFAESIERAARCGDDRQRAWSLSLLARAHLLRDERGQAAAALAECIDLARRQRWMAFLPWPQALRAELDLQAGDMDTAADGFEHAWALGCQVDDPCWEAVAARGLALLYAAKGDHEAAAGWYGEAAARCVRVPDRYQWIHGHVLDAAIGAALDRGDQRTARTLTGTLGTLAARCGLRELVVRAHLHAYRLGDRPALAAARLLGAGIDNPALARLLV
jgi:DNA-binding SARP family transcriptional activator